MKMIGIKLADGSFYPLLEEGTPAKKTLFLTTARDNQTTIMVDLYRSETKSMEGAEYAATLQIDNLVKHPNGEPDISFLVSLDKDDNLSAEIKDAESGEHSKIKVSLAKHSSDYSPSKTDEFSPALSTTNDNGGLLKSAALKDVSKSALDFSGLDLPEDLDFTKPIEENNDFIEPKVEPDFSDNDNFTEPTISTTENSTTEKTSSSDDFEIPDIDFDFDKNISKTETSSDLDLPRDFTEKDFFFADTSDDTDDINNLSSNDTTFEQEESETNDYKFNESEIPSFDYNEENTFDSSNDSITEDNETYISSNEDNEFSDDFITDINSENEYANKTSEKEFTDFYKNDPIERSNTKYQTESSIKRKTKAPVIICLLCALICIIATILILFIIPSKYNLISSRNTRENEITTITEKAPQKDDNNQVAQSAKPNEIVVEPKAEIVEPVKPVVTEQAKKDISYKIKWGDTLWDIADAYYKNPWRYPRIAEYNNIRDPDYIISGTVISIPLE